MSVLKFIFSLLFLAIWMIVYIGACGKEVATTNNPRFNTGCLVSSPSGSLCVQYRKLPEVNSDAIEKSCTEFYGSGSDSSEYFKNYSCPTDNQEGACSGFPENVTGGAESLVIYYYKVYTGAETHCTGAYKGSWTAG